MVWFININGVRNIDLDNSFNWNWYNSFDIIRLVNYDFDVVWLWVSYLDFIRLWYQVFNSDFIWDIVWFVYNNCVDDFIWYLDSNWVINVYVNSSFIRDFNIISNLNFLFDWIWDTSLDIFDIVAFNNWLLISKLRWCEW